MNVTRYALLWRIFDTVGAEILPSSAEVLRSLLLRCPPKQVTRVRDEFAQLLSDMEGLRLTDPDGLEFVGDGHVAARVALVMRGRAQVVTVMESGGGAVPWPVDFALDLPPVIDDVCEEVTGHVVGDFWWEPGVSYQVYDGDFPAYAPEANRGFVAAGQVLTSSVELMDALRASGFEALVAEIWPWPGARRAVKAATSGAVVNWEVVLDAEQAHAWTFNDAVRSVIDALPVLARRARIAIPEVVSERLAALLEVD